MTNPFIRPLAGAVAIAAIVALTPIAGAQAQVRCSTDGWSWHCTDYAPAPPPVWGHPRDHNFRGGYHQIPNDYQGPAPGYDNRY